MKELKVIKQVMPLIEINFDEVKAGLQQELSKYEGIIVTAETLPDCVVMQKELSGVRRTIDGMRLDIQREAKKPLDHFTAQMKELMGLVMAVETPLKKGLGVFDDARIEAKGKEIRELRANMVDKSDLQPEYHDKLTMVAKWMNKGTTMKAVAEDIAGQISDQLALQNLRDENVTAIEGVAKSMGEGLATPLDSGYYVRQLDSGSTLTSILGLISADAKRQEDAEKKAVTAAEEEKETLSTPPPSTTDAGATSEASEPVTRTVTIKVTATGAKLADLGIFLKANNYAFEKVDG